MRNQSATHIDVGAPNIDLAPMLDFVVNLLIFFIITAVFVKQAGVTVGRPTVSSGIEAPSMSVVIDEQGEISIDAKSVDIRALRAHVEQYRATSERGIVVVAHEHARTGVLVAVVDQIRLGGVSDITFTTAQ
jgi:biopolymer transport protein ExbD